MSNVKRMTGHGMHLRPNKGSHAPVHATPGEAVDPMQLGGSRHAQPQGGGMSTPGMNVHMPHAPHPLATMRTPRVKGY